MKVYLSVLTHTVECRPPAQAFFEVIAAFNVDRAALAYGGECHMVNPSNAYRVRDIATEAVVRQWGVR